LGEDEKVEEKNVHRIIVENPEGKNHLVDQEVGR
jgi:hypothetical protein